MVSKAAAKFVVVEPLCEPYLSFHARMARMGHFRYPLAQCNYLNILDHAIGNVALEEQENSRYFTR